MSDMAGGLGPRLGKSAAAVERCGKQPRYNRAVGASEMDGQVCVGNR